MAFNAYVGSFTSRTTTGSQSITGVGFQPKVVLFFTGVNTGAQTTFANWGFGAAQSSTKRWVIAAGAQDALAAADDNRAFLSTACIHGVTAAAADFIKADFTSQDADGFTISWSVVDASARVIHFIALGGTDLNVDVGTFDLTTGTGNQAKTGIGFQPVATIFGNTRADTTEGNTTNACFMLGHAVSSTDQRVSTLFGVDAADPTDEQAVMWTDKCIGRIDSAGAIVCSASFVSNDADGFTVNKVVGPTANTRIGYVALGGTIRAKGGTFTSPLAVGQQTISGVGFRPDVLLFNGMTTSTSIGTTNTGSSKAFIGASDTGIRNHAFDAIAVNNLGTSDTYRLDSTTKALLCVSTSGTGLVEGTLAGVLPDGFTLDFTTVTTTNINYFYLALSGAANGTTSTKGRLSQLPTEVIRTNLGVKAQLSQLPAEVIRTNLAVKAQLSQLAVEAISPNPNTITEARLSQEVLEVARTNLAPEAQLGQIVIEVARFQLPGVEVPLLEFELTLPDQYEGQGYFVPKLSYTQGLLVPEVIPIVRVARLDFNYDLLPIEEEAPILTFTSQLFPPSFVIGNNVDLLPFTSTLLPPVIERPLFLYTSQLFAPDLVVPVKVPLLTFTQTLLKTSLNPPVLKFEQELLPPTIISAGRVAGSGLLLHH